MFRRLGWLKSFIALLTRASAVSFVVSAPPAIKACYIVFSGLVCSTTIPAFRSVGMRNRFRTAVVAVGDVCVEGRFSAVDGGIISYFKVKLRDFISNFL